MSDARKPRRRVPRVGPASLSLRLLGCQKCCMAAVDDAVRSTLPDDHVLTNTPRSKGSGSFAAVAHSRQCLWSLVPAALMVLLFRWHEHSTVARATRQADALQRQSNVTQGRVQALRQQRQELREQLAQLRAAGANSSNKAELLGSSVKSLRKEIVRIDQERRSLVLSLNQGSAAAAEEITGAELSVLPGGHHMLSLSRNYGPVAQRQLELAHG